MNIISEVMEESWEESRCRRSLLLFIREHSKIKIKIKRNRASRFIETTQIAGEHANIKYGNDARYSV